MNHYPHRFTTARRTPFLLVAALLLSLVAIATMPGQANAAAGCVDGSRKQAKEYAAAGKVFNPTDPVVWTGSPPVGPVGNTLTWSIQLRVNPDNRCSWALVTGDGWSTSAYLQRSTDGGATWGDKFGSRSIRVGDSSTYTGVFAPQPGTLIRACGTASDTSVRCTPGYGG